MLTPAVTAALAALTGKVSASNLWIARALRDTDSSANAFRKYARWAVGMGQVPQVRSLLYQRMLRETPRAVNLINQALAVFDSEIELTKEIQR